jgi:cell wall assembly regulator SMI1
MMKNVLKRISELAIKSGNTQYSKEQIESKWLGNYPASVEGIEYAEKKLSIKFPQDYRDFLLLTNGFAATSNHTEPRFEAIENVDYLVNIESFMVETWNQKGLEDIGKELARSIIIGGIEEEQYFLIIPPDSLKGHWKYWEFASWIPGEYPFEDLLAYFTNVLENMEERG